MRSPSRSASLVAGLVLIILATVLLSTTLVNQAQSQNHSPQHQSITYQPIAPELSLPQPARTFSDIYYCNTTDIRQSLDIHVPAYQPHQLVPFVVYVHGGGWSNSSKRNGFIDFYRTYFLQRGMAVVSINHRLAPQFTYPAQDNDLECALSYLHVHAAKYGLDATRIGLFGESSGAQLITSVALASHNNQAEWKSSIRAVVPYYGISDFYSLLHDPRYRGQARLYLGPKPLTVAKQASALHHPLQDPPDFYIFHGDRDSVIPSDQSVALHRYLQKFGGHSQLLIVKNSDHGFGMSGQPTVEQIRQMMLDFFSQSFQTKSPLINP